MSFCQIQFCKAQQVISEKQNCCYLFNFHQSCHVGVIFLIRCQLRMFKFLNSIILRNERPLISFNKCNLLYKKYFIFINNQSIALGMGRGRYSRSRSPQDDQRQKKRNRQRVRQRSREKFTSRCSRSPSKGRQRNRDEKKKTGFADNPYQQKALSKATELSNKLSQSLHGSKQQIKGLSLMKKLNPANKNLGLGITLVQGSSSFPLGLNTGIFSMMADASKIKRKIKLPKDSNFNYSGLLIGPKGNSQKQLQQRTGCKILVRGKGSQGQPNDIQDDEDLHVLVLGDNEAQVAKACAQIQRIIFADQDTLNKMKQQQMVQYQQGIAGQGQGDYNLSLTTPYGPPSQNAYILQVPNECVGLVIGKEGQTIKAIGKRSGAEKVQVATGSAPGSKTRNIFVEGDPDAVERVRKQLNAIVETQRKMTSGATTGSHRMQVEVPTRLIGLVIGKGGQTIKGINTKTGAFVCLSKDEPTRRSRKVLTISGTQDLCWIAKYQIDKIVQKGLINLQNSTGGLTSDETQMIHPLTPIAIQLNQMNIPIPMNHPTIVQDPATQYAVNQSLQNQIPTSTLFRQFLGSTTCTIEQTFIDNAYGGKPNKKKWVP